MAYSYIKPRRVTLTATTATAVNPPFDCKNVEIGNATPDDLRVYEDPNDATTYFVVPAGYAKTLSLKDAAFRNKETAFYLYAVQAGTAVLIWS